MSIRHLGSPDAGEDEDPLLDAGVVLDALPPLEPDDDRPVETEIRIDVPDLDDPTEGETGAPEAAIPLELPPDADAEPDSGRDFPAWDAELITPLLDADEDDAGDVEPPVLPLLSDLGAIEDEERFTDPGAWDFGGELPREPGFVLEWQDGEMARQLLAMKGGFVALGKDCRHCALDGRVIARRALPPGFRRAAIVRRATWTGVSSSVDPPGGFELLCIAGEKLHLRSEDGWRTLGDEDAPFDVAARDLVQRDDDVLLGGRDGRWYSFEEGTLRLAFGGRRLLSLCAASTWVGLEEQRGERRLLALEGEAARPLSVCPVGQSSRLVARGDTLVMETSGEGLWLSNESGAGLDRVSGSQRFRGVCLGERQGRVKLWTTLEEGDSVVLVEIDVRSGRQAAACTLPWRASDDDSPTVFDLLWLAEERLLLVASDFGVACLRLGEASPDSPPAGTAG